MSLTNRNSSQHGLNPVHISANLEVSPNVYVISWKRGNSFTPGQVVKISLNLNDAPRIYSICSGNKEEEISVLYNVKSDGALTPHLSALKKGDKIYVSDPYGSFSCDESPACWISTGTGIAPFHSMIQSGNTKNKILLHGASYANQFYFSEYLHRELGDNYIRCCSREKVSGDLDSQGKKEGAKGVRFPGRVTDYLSTVGELPEAYKYYLCGQALMVVEVRDLLIQKGVPYDRIYAEIFF